MSNIEKFASQMLEDYAADLGHGPVSSELEPVKGYFTTRVYQFRVFQDGRPVRTCFIKESGDREVQRFNDYIAREYSYTEHVYNHFRHSDTLTTTRPIAYSAEHYAFTIEKIEGERLDRYLLRHLYPWSDRRPLEKVLDLVTEWLNRFQEIEFDPGDKPLDFHEREFGKLEFLESRIYEKMLPRDESRLAQIFQAMEDRLTQIKAVGQANVIKHNDFAPWNMMFDGERLGVIDFADCTVDVPFYDMLYFMHSLEKIVRKRPLSRSRVRDSQAYLANRCGLTLNMQTYYKCYFRLQDLENVLRGVYDFRYRKKSRLHTKVISYLRFRYQLSQLHKILFDENR